MEMSRHLNILCLERIPRIPLKGSVSIHFSPFQNNALTLRDILNEVQMLRILILLYKLLMHLGASGTFKNLLN